MALEFHVQVALYVLFNIVSVVGVVAVNKMLYRDYELQQPTCLMTFHFLCTWLFVMLAKRLRWFTEKRIDVGNYVRLGLAQCCSVVFVNLSLVHNSIGMYQVLKFSNVLMMCWIEYVWKAKLYSLQVYLSLAALVAGITAATVTDVELRWLGFTYGMLGCLSTAVYQILNKSIQQDFDVSPLQILEFEQPFTALFAALFALVTEDVGHLAKLDYTDGGFVTLLLVSGFFAFGVNVTCYLIIGKTTPITYAVVGHTKTIFILLFGILWMKDSWTWKSGSGLLIAFAAIVAYTHYSQFKPGVNLYAPAMAGTATQQQQQSPSCAPPVVCAVGSGAGAGGTQPGLHSRIASGSASAENVVLLACGSVPPTGGIIDKDA
jgi:solute carrier family 35 protein E3